MRSIGLGALFFAVLAAAFAVAMDGQPPGTSHSEPRLDHVFAPEHYFYPVQESDPAYRGEPGWELRPNTPTRSNRPIGFRPDSLGYTAYEAKLHGMTLSHPSSSAFPENQAPGPDLASSWQPGQGSTSRMLDGTSLPLQPGHAGSSYQASDFQRPLEQQQGGAYILGSDKFSMHTYPLDLPAFKHLYSDDGALFENFERHFDGIQLISRGTVFRPDPEILRAIQHQIWKQLASKGVHPKPVSPDIPLHEGEYLWPPVEASQTFAGQLEISPYRLGKKLRKTISRRLDTHSGKEPRLFRMDLKMGSDTRHILMFPVRHADFVGGSVTAPGPSPWLFYEGVTYGGARHPHQEIFRLAVLGSTYLPQGTEAHLRGANILEIAFLDAARAHLH
ncbi:uncharacterized protein UTRI_10382 [Ustilago trichophora]|uniref:Effector family protein Eff1 n=1 Tax=Ustilago trichophora TaxID=86804 RepID=A0A5C3EB64_9BASI|nr:uncharacterized protein UTRI_10382 [Ustilago trichophora]